jgi:protein tyrosine phosphatase (PTP) superfamily phosphohydrolase (DUF442 family)
MAPIWVTSQVLCPEDYPARHLPVDTSNLSLRLADDLMSCVEELPKPLLITCNTGARSSAVAAMHVSARLVSAAACLCLPSPVSQAPLLPSSS